MEGVTLSWLFHSHKYKLKDIKTVKDLKKFIWERSKLYIRNEAFFLRGMRQINWQKLFDTFIDIRKIRKLD